MKLQKQKLSLPFNGKMTCTFCALSVTGTAHVYAGGWRAVDASNRKRGTYRVYACPQCRPAADADKEAFADFYYQLGQQLATLLRPKRAESFVIWRERDGQMPERLKVGSDCR